MVHHWRISNISTNTFWDDKFFYGGAVGLSGMFWSDTENGNWKNSFDSNNFISNAGEVGGGAVAITTQWVDLVIEFETQRW